MTQLQQQSCAPCDDNREALGEKQIKKYLSNEEVAGWEHNENKEAIQRTFTLDDFKQAISFVNKLAEIAEQEQHHPDITINYNKVTLSLKTHSIGALHDNDFIMAAKINTIAE